MKCLYFLLLVVASQAYVTRVEELKYIPTPTLTKLTTIDPYGFVLSWTPVTSEDSSDPILGYKVKLWEYGTKTVYQLVTIDGVSQLVEQQVPVKIPSTLEDKIPEGEPMEYIVKGAENTSLKVENIKPSVTYEMRAQAYTKTGAGPMSKPMRVSLGPKP